jgi:TolB-like protein/DNA-binding winged helix-turn-helix (wHTH) protein
MPTEEELDKGFEIGEWEILPARGIFRRGEQEVHPEPKVFAVFMSLAMRDGDMVTRDQLVAEHWDGRPTSDEAINQKVAQLRRHLGDTAPFQYIETLTGRGYRLKKRVLLKHSEPPAQLSAENNKPPFRKLPVAIALLAVAVFVAYWIAKPPPSFGDIRSVAVLPFDNLSTLEDDQYIAIGLKEEVVRTLGNISELNVKNGRVSYADKEFTEIAQILSVDGLLLGFVQREGDRLKIGYQLIDGRTGHNVSSQTITKPLADLFALQLELARAIRKDLLGKSSQQLMSSSRPENFGAYDSYLRGLYVFEYRGKSGNLEKAIELFEETISLDANFGPAYLMLAKAYVLMPDFRDAPLDEWHGKAIDIVEQGIAVDGSIRDAAGAIFGLVYHKQKRWSESEQAYLRATRAAIVDPDAFNWYSRMLASVGRLDEALVQALAGMEVDPSSAISNSRVAIAYTWLDEPEKAAEYYARSNQLGANTPQYILAYGWSLLREGRFDEAGELARISVTRAGKGTGWIKPFFASFSDPALRSEALDAIGESSAAGLLDPLIEVPARVALGDIDGAMSVARLLEEPGEAFEMDILFIREMLPLRQHPEFLDLMQNLGIQSYWDESGCLWQSAAVHCPKVLQD